MQLQNCCAPSRELVENNEAYRVFRRSRGADPDRGHSSLCRKNPTAKNEPFRRSRGNGTAKMTPTELFVGGFRDAACAASRSDGACAFGIAGAPDEDTYSAGERP